MILKELSSWFPGLEPTTLNSLEEYAAELLRFNKAINLVSASTVDKLSKVHFADCLLGCEILFKSLPNDAQLYDIGSGNGFPGIIVSIMRPEQKVILVEKDKRKAEFLSHVGTLLKLGNLSVRNESLEDLPAGSISWAVSRAFAPLDKALFKMRHYMTKGGRYFHFKSDTWSIEMAHVPSQLFSAWKAEHLGDYKIPGSETVHAVICTMKL